MATVVSTPIIRSRQGSDLQQGLQSLLAGLQQFSQARKRKKDFEVLSNMAHQLSGRRGAVGQPGGGPQQPQPPSTQQGLDLVLSNLARLQTNQGVKIAWSMADVLNQRAKRKSSTPFSKINPKDYTAESLTKFSQSGNVADLTPRKETNKPSAFREKVDALQPFVGGEEEAVKLASGVITTATDPFSKKLKVVDLSQRDVKGKNPEVEIDTSGLTKIGKDQLAKIIEEAKNVTLWDLSGLSTGPISSALNAYNKTFALLGLPPAKKTEVARTHLKLAGIAVTSALSNNSRYPEGLRKWILKQTNVEPSFFKRSELARQDYIALNSFVREKIASEMNFLQTVISPKAKQESILAIKALEEFRVKLGVPDDAGEDTGSERKVVEADGTVIIQMPDGTYKIEEPK